MKPNKGVKKGILLCYGQTMYLPSDTLNGTRKIQNFKQELLHVKNIFF